MKCVIALSLLLIVSCTHGRKTRIQDLSYKLQAAEHHLMLAEQEAVELRLLLYREQISEIRQKVNSISLEDPTLNLANLFQEERKSLNEMIINERSIKDEAQEVLNHILRLITQLNSAHTQNL